MNKEKIILPEFVIADLYKNHLIQPLQGNDQDTKTLEKENEIEKEGSKVKLIHYLGGNAKKVIVLVSNSTTTFINDDELTFLSKILNALNLTIADVAIINVNKNDITFDKVMSELKAEFILLLGVEPASVQLPFTMPNFQVQQFADCTIVRAPSLESMLLDLPENIRLKRQLWTCLQKVFTVE